MKNLNWSQLTDDILEKLDINQSELAKLCKVTQQTVSNWKTNTRSPGVYARNKLRELSADAKLKIDKYKIKNADKSGVLGKPDLDLPEEILAFAQRLDALPKRQKDKILDMASYMINEKMK